MQSIKPLGRKAYGHIPHLPGSRTGPGDYHIHEGQARIATIKIRDKHDTVIVQEKLDGSNVCIAKLANKIIALTRSGYLAETSPYEQHHLFHEWVKLNTDRFGDLLKNGERVCGEWLVQAHGTKYELHHEPFVVFDLFDKNNKRLGFDQFVHDVCMYDFITPKLLHIGAAITIDEAMAILGENGFHGAADFAEGAVWRVERNGEVDFLCKHVRAIKIDGIYLPENNGNIITWNI